MRVRHNFAWIIPALTLLAGCTPTGQQPASAPNVNVKLVLIKYPGATTGTLQNLSSTPLSDIHLLAHRNDEFARLTGNAEMDSHPAATAPPGGSIEIRLDAAYDALSNLRVTSAGREIPFTVELHEAGQ